MEYLNHVLSLSFRDDKDERTQEAIKKMINRVWRDIDGQRN